MKKAYNSLLIAQTVGMYLMVVPVLLFVLPINSSEVFARSMLITYLVLVAIVFHICLANLIVAVIGAIKGIKNPSKVTMIHKLVLIPWFIANFVLVALLAAGMLNPFLFFAIPVMIGIAASTTYVYMIGTSLFDVAFFVRSLIKRQINKKAPLIVATIFLFIFCLDIIGSIIFYTSSKEIE